MHAGWSLFLSMFGCRDAESAGHSAGYPSTKRSYQAAGGRGQEVAPLPDASALCCRSERSHFGLTRARVASSLRKLEHALQRVALVQQAGAVRRWASVSLDEGGHVQVLCLKQGQPKKPDLFLPVNVDMPHC